MLMKLVTPAPVAPVAPVAPLTYSKGSEDTAGNNITLGYIKDDIKEIKNSLKEITNSHVTITDFNNQVKQNTDSHSDHETRIRSIETSVTRMMTWGTVIITLATLLQVGLRLMGK